MAEMDDKSKGKNGQGFIEQGIFLIICAIISAAVGFWASSNSMGKEIEKIKIEKTAENLQNDKIYIQNIVDSCLHYYTDVYFKLKYNKINRDDIPAIRAKINYLSLLYMIYVRPNHDNDTIFYRLEGNFHAALIFSGRGIKLSDDLDSQIEKEISFLAGYTKIIILSTKDKTQPIYTAESEKETKKLPNDETATADICTTLPFNTLGEPNIVGDCTISLSGDSTIKVKVYHITGKAELLSL